MGLVKGNITPNDTTAIRPTAPLTATITTHSQNTGSAGLIVAVVFYNNVKTCTGATWNGSSMTKEITVNNNDLGAALQYDVWYLVAPSTGNHDLVYTFDTGGSNCTSLITSFTGADQTTPLQSLTSGVATSPHTQAITIAANSMIMGIATSRQSQSVVDCINIDGTGFGFGSCDIDTAVSSAQVSAETRNANLSAGSKNVKMTTDAPSFLVDNTRIEIIEAAADPSIIR